MTNIFKLQVHPSAAIFPLMDEDEPAQFANAIVGTRMAREPFEAQGDGHEIFQLFVAVHGGF